MAGDKNVCYDLEEKYYNQDTEYLLDKLNDALSNFKEYRKYENAVDSENSKDEKFVNKFLARTFYKEFQYIIRDAFIDIAFEKQIELQRFLMSYDWAFNISTLITIKEVAPEKRIYEHLVDFVLMQIDYIIDELSELRNALGPYWKPHKSEYGKKIKEKINVNSPEYKELIYEIIDILHFMLNLTIPCAADKYMLYGNIIKYALYKFQNSNVKKIETYHEINIVIREYIYVITEMIINLKRLVYDFRNDIKNVYVDETYKTKFLFKNLHLDKFMYEYMYKIIDLFSEFFARSIVFLYDEFLNKLNNEKFKQYFEEFNEDVTFKFIVGSFAQIYYYLYKNAENFNRYKNNY